jgi:hypothetical protein
MGRMRFGPITMFVAGLGFALFVVCLFLIGWGEGDRNVTRWLTLVVSGLSLAISAFAVLVPDERARYDNTFALAKRWDEEPMLRAREELRRHLEDLPSFIYKIGKGDVDAERAVVSLINFYWNIGAALEEQWADPNYLRRRFAPSLKKWYPAIRAYLNDDSGKVSMEAMDALARRWEITPTA